jgi:hypothetical protein
MQKLQSFAQNNKETQGKFTIGDEKVRGREEQEMLSFWSLGDH